MRTLRGLIIALAFVLIGLIALLTGCSTQDNDENRNPNNNINNNTNTVIEYTVEEPFTFNNLETTFHSNISWERITLPGENENQYVVVMPITVTNIGNIPNTINMIFYSIYGPNETEVDSLAMFFPNNNIEYAGHIEPGETIQSNIHFLFDGNGEYTILFNDYFFERIWVVFQIEK